MMWWRRIDISMTWRRQWRRTNDGAIDEKDINADPDRVADTVCWGSIDHTG